MLAISSGPNQILIEIIWPYLGVSNNVERIESTYIIKCGKNDHLLELQKAIHKLAIFFVILI